MSNVHDQLRTIEAAARTLSSQVTPNTAGVAANAAAIAVSEADIIANDASAFYHDGTKVATGDFDLDGNNLLDTLIFNNASGNFIFGDYSIGSIFFIRSATSGKYGRFTAGPTNIKYDAVGAAMDVILQTADGHIDFYPNGVIAARINSSGNTIVGGTTVDLGGKLQVSSTGIGIELRDSDTNLAGKFGAVATTAYVNAQVPMAMLYANPDITSNDLLIGGGAAAVQAATAIDFYAAAAVNTATGTRIATITPAGMEVLSGALLLGDNTRAFFGDADDAEIYYNNSNLVIKADVVGGGVVLMETPMILLADNRTIIFGAGQDAQIYYDSVDFNINPKLVGSGLLRVLGAGLFDQDVVTGAKPVLHLDQADVSEEFIRFVGESTTDNTQSLIDAANLTTPGTIQGWLRIYVEDVQGTGPITDGIYFVPFYSTPTA